MHTVTITLAYLRGLAKICASQDVRYYLCGVLIERRGDSLFYAATDGHKLAVFHNAVEENEKGGDDFTIIVPCDVAKRCVALKSLTKATLTIGEKESRIDPTKNGALVFVPVDGTFPDWRRVLPKQPKPNGKLAQFNPHYLAAIKDCLETATGRANILPEVFPDGGSPAAIVADENFYGCIMPFRGSENPSAPAWL